MPTLPPRRALPAERRARDSCVEPLRPDTSGLSHKWMDTSRNVLAAAASLVAAVVCVVPAMATQDGGPLYTCVDPAVTRTLDVGATVCDAAPTETLTQRVEVDNLQLRAGALVTEVIAEGLAQVAGLRPGDVIYRVAGRDVDNTVEATARLSLLQGSADTVVNFLRRGRPYRVKIRRP